jgi:hypothetical protein
MRLLASYPSNTCRERYASKIKVRIETVYVILRSN